MHTTQDSRPISDSFFAAEVTRQDSPVISAAGTGSAHVLQQEKALHAALTAPAVFRSTDGDVPARAAGAVSDGGPIVAFPAFSFPDLPLRDTVHPWKTMDAGTSIRTLLSVMNVMFDDSFLERLQQMDGQLRSKQGEHIKQFNKEQADLQRIREQQQTMTPGQIAQLACSALALVVGIALPIFGPVLASLALAGTITGSITAALSLSVSIADQAIKNSPNPPMRLNEKGEQIPLEGMSIDILVEMATDAEVRNGSIVIDGEPSQATPKPLARHVTREQFEQSKKDGAMALNVILIALPLVLGVGAFFQGGGLALLKNLPEKIGTALNEAASTLKNIKSSVGDFLQLSTTEMRQQVAASIETGIKRLGDPRVVGNTDSALRILHNLSTASQAGVKIQQSILTIELAQLQASLGKDRKDMQETQGEMDILNGGMPIVASTFKQLQDAQLEIAKTVAKIIQQTNAPGRSAARNMAAATA